MNPIIIRFNYKKPIDFWMMGGGFDEAAYSKYPLLLHNTPVISIKNQVILGRWSMKMNMKNSLVEFWG